MAVKKYRKDFLYSYTLGITLTIELLKTKPETVHKVYLHSSFEHNESYLLITSLAKKYQIPLEVNDKTFQILSDKENCFVIGEFSKFNPKINSDASHLVLVNPSNAGNLGTIIRTMVGFEIKDLAIIRPGVDIFDPKVIRASMGAIFHINFSYFDTFDAYHNTIKKRGIYPFMLIASKPLSEVSPKAPYSLVFGNEATGLPTEFVNLGQSVIIPHSHAIDSLNLPIAVAIALYEVTKNNFSK